MNLVQSTAAAKAFHDASVLCLTFTVNASPPDESRQLGCYDVAVFALEEAQKWLRSGLKGALYIVGFHHLIGSIRTYCLSSMDDHESH